MYKYVFMLLLTIVWLYSTICLICLSMTNDYYIKSIPMLDHLGTFQIYNFIPLCIFTSYFDKKIYIQDE